MEFGVGVLVFGALGLGVFLLLRRRTRRATEQKARADKHARTARADADAIRRTLAGRR